jgi:hypothetical protein
LQPSLVSKHQIRNNKSQAGNLQHQIRSTKFGSSAVFGSAFGIWDLVVSVGISGFGFGAYTATAIRDWTADGPEASAIQVTVAVLGSSAVAL